MRTINGELLSPFARKLATIEIWEDARDPESPRTSIDEANGEHAIILSSGGVPMPQAAVIAHELGHIVGAITQTRAHVNDPRTPGPHSRMSSPAAASVNAYDLARTDRTFASELEAWKFARLIKSDISTFDMARALYTYNPHLTNWGVNWDTLELL